MRVLVTRPLAQAQEWTAKLRAMHINAVSLPLITIEPLESVQALSQAWADLDTRQLVVFVSPNAAEQFFGVQPELRSWPAGVWAASPGPGTTQVLSRLGVPRDMLIEPASDAAQFDSESLWAQLALHDWRGAQVLVVRGTVGRDWLVQQLQLQGAMVAVQEAYRRRIATLDTREQSSLAQALAAPRGHLWFFSSSEAIDHLDRLAMNADWTAAQALATHPRIASRARALGIGLVHEVRPKLEAVVACIQSIES